MFKRLLSVPTCSFNEGPLVAYIVDHVNQRGATHCGRVIVDEHNNVFIVKGNAQFVHCLAAHLDTVHRWTEVQIVEQDGLLVGYDTSQQRVGIGADDKAGVYICLALLERFENIKIAFFAAEEVGCIGAKRADAEFFDSVGYVMEYDCPGKGLVSRTSGGVQLFRDDGELIQMAMPVLKQYESTKFEHHPYTDVMALRQRFDFECLNLSAGYHNWHRRDEYANLKEIATAIEMGEALIRALGNRRYGFEKALAKQDDRITNIPCLADKPM